VIYLQPSEAAAIHIRTPLAAATLMRTPLVAKELVAASSWPIYQDGRAQKMENAIHGMRTSAVPVAIPMDEHMIHLSSTNQRTIWERIGWTSQILILGVGA
jgi:hypothetical protein